MVLVAVEVLVTAAVSAILAVTTSSRIAKRKAFAGLGFIQVA
jgi:hypothetical protein